MDGWVAEDQIGWRSACRLRNGWWIALRSISAGFCFIFEILISFFPISIWLEVSLFLCPVAFFGPRSGWFMDEFFFSLLPKISSTRFNQLSYSHNKRLKNIMQMTCVRAVCVCVRMWNAAKSGARKKEKSSFSRFGAAYPPLRAAIAQL